MNRKLPLLCTVALLLLATHSTNAAPRLILEESEFNFGYVPQNSVISHIFWLKSAGDDALKITKVIPGCGCTKAPLEKSELAVGDSTRLEIIFSTKRYKSRVSKSPTIETNEGPPHKRIRISAQVVARPDSTYPIIFKPYKLDISQFGEKVRDEMKFSITNISDQDIDIALIDRPEGLFDVKLPRTIKAGATAHGVLRLDDEGTESSFEKSITIELDDELSSRYTIPIKRNLRKLGKQASATGADKK